MPIVTFRKIKDARTGNILFQYLFCKRLSLAYGHQYVPIEDCGPEVFGPGSSINVTDDNAKEILFSGSLEYIKQQHIVCEGFFQRSEYYVPVREALLQMVRGSDDWLKGVGQGQSVGHQFVRSENKIPISEKDVVVSLRLDDFIQLPCPTSDIIPPSDYLSILESISFDRLFIVCDKIRHDWEHRYLRFFDKWSPIMVQGTLEEDAAVMRDAPTLIHSNSTLCWFMSFLGSTDKRRFIFNTHFYGGQNLDAISPDTDRVISVKPLMHKGVYALNYSTYLKSTSIWPMSYSIPDEQIVDSDIVAQKTQEVADLVPGQPNTYCYGPGQEREYNDMYRRARFAYTMKKGGWDCLRHYEIMANGCIPIFRGLDQCPADTLTTFPKRLIQEVNQRFEDGTVDEAYYHASVKQMLDHVRLHCSVSSTAHYFLQKMGNPSNNRDKPGYRVLMIRCDPGVNYSRETFWIGLHRHITGQGGVAVEYPRIDYLYDTWSGDKGKLYGNGFTYAGRIHELGDTFGHAFGPRFSENEIVDKIKSRWFDFVIYGKVGPDELRDGSMPHLPVWDHVFASYKKPEIAFLYGGDECIDLTTENRYSSHILKHAAYATCFVRELRR